MNHRDQIQAGMRAAEERAKRLHGEDTELAAREEKLRSEIVATERSDVEALAAVRSGADLTRKAGRSVDAARHELEVVVAARRALTSEIVAANAEASGFRGTLDRLIMRDIGARAIANGARIDRLIGELDEALAEGAALYSEATNDRLAFRLRIQALLMEHLCGSFRVGSALPQRIRELARMPFAGRHRVEDIDRAFFGRFERD